MKNLKAILEEAGESFGSVVKTTVLLSDMGNFAAVNEIYGALRRVRSKIARWRQPLQVRRCT